MVTLKEPVYFVDILHDAGYANFCLKTSYYFENKALGILFVEYLNNIDNIVVRGDVSEAINYISNDRDRPKFQDLLLAITDLDSFIQYCSHYLDHPLYEYQESVYEVGLREYRCLYLLKVGEQLKNEISDLTKENVELIDIIMKIEEENIELKKQLTKANITFL